MIHKFKKNDIVIVHPTPMCQEGMVGLILDVDVNALEYCILDVSWFLSTECNRDFWVREEDVSVIVYQKPSPQILKSTLTYYGIVENIKEFIRRLL